MNTNKHLGFTVSEIMIVVVLVCVLVGISVPQFMKARADNMRNHCIARLTQMEAAKRAWAYDNSSRTNAVLTEDQIFGTYIAKKPVCPAGGKYTLGTVGSKAIPVTCSKARHPHYHELPQLLERRSRNY